MFVRLFFRLLCRCRFVDTDHVSIGTSERRDLPVCRVLNGSVEIATELDAPSDHLVHVLDLELQQGRIPRRDLGLGGDRPETDAQGLLLCLLLQSAGRHRPRGSPQIGPLVRRADHLETKPAGIKFQGAGEALPGTDHQNYSRQVCQHGWPWLLLSGHALSVSKRYFANVAMSFVSITVVEMAAIIRQIVCFGENTSTCENRLLRSEDDDDRKNEKMLHVLHCGALRTCLCWISAVMPELAIFEKEHSVILHACSHKQD